MTRSGDQGGGSGTGRRTGRRLAALAGLLVLALVLVSGLDRRAAAPARGHGFRGPAAAAPGETLRVATWNVHAGRAPDGSASLADVARALEGVDFAGLQELSAPWLGPDQAEALGGLLGAAWCFAPSERRFWRDHFGNGALARVEVGDWRRVPLPCTRGKAYRSYLLATVAFGPRGVRVLVTHLDGRQDREPQLGTVLSVFADLPAPAVLLGDLNTRPGDAQLAALLAGGDAVDASPELEDRVDWILVRGFRVLDRGVDDPGASDHPCLWAELALPDAPAPGG